MIVTLRADFYDRPLVYPRFGEVFAAGTEVVSPLTPDETEQAISDPPKELASPPNRAWSRIVADVAHQPVLCRCSNMRLPSCSNAGKATDSRSPHKEAGGVAGALSARADRIFEATSPDARRMSSRCSRAW